MPVCIFMQYPINYCCSQTSMFCCVSPFHWPFTPLQEPSMEKNGGLNPSLLRKSPCLVGWALPLWKMMEWKSVGMMKFPTEWKVIKFHGSSHHQPDVCWNSPPFVKSPRPQNSHRTIELQGTRHLSHSRHGLARAYCPRPTSIPRPHPGAKCQEPWRTMALSMKCREIREHHAGLLQLFHHGFHCSVASGTLSLEKRWIHICQNPACLDTRTSKSQHDWYIVFPWFLPKNLSWSYTSSIQVFQGFGYPCFAGVYPSFSLWDTHISQIIL